jgi:pimeloyl-ACP methyl ester carboxylesterase
MEYISEKVVDGVAELRFEMTADGQAVPGIRWSPEGITGPRPTVLMGHGGFQSKEAPNIVAMGGSMARERGWATIAMDAPEHGDRRTEEQIRRQEAALRRLRTDESPRDARRSATPERNDDRQREAAPDTRVAVGPNASMPRMSREWKALLDEIDGTDLAGTSYGYWGVSMGARNGIPLVANEPRIIAAVFGLFAYLPDRVFREQVKAITVPLLFLFQYNDELMTPAAGLALWEAFGSPEKTMHINPGPHVGIPVFERAASAEFLARHLR